MPPPRGLSCWNSAQYCNQVCCTDRKSIPSALPNISVGTTFSLKKDQFCVRKHRNKNSVWRSYTHLVLQLLFPSWHPRGLMDLHLYNRHLRRIKELPQAFSTPCRQHRTPSHTAWQEATAWGISSFIAPVMQLSTRRCSTTKEQGIKARLISYIPGLTAAGWTPTLGRSVSILSCPACWEPGLWPWQDPARKQR